LEPVIAHLPNRLIAQLPPRGVLGVMAVQGVLWMGREGGEEGAMSGYPERIVCLTEETTETLYLLGEGHRVVGISGYTVRPPGCHTGPPAKS
jgi:ABC-type hemin transport system substrate-binding protein